MDVFLGDTSETLSRALGEAIIRMWGSLPHDLQNRLFKEAVFCQERNIRPQLAVFLHEKHPRTCAAIKARAMLEPDSLGG